MTTLQGSNDALRSGSLNTEEHGPNTEFIKNAIPDWLIGATPARREAFRQAPTQILDWYKNATVEQRQEVKRLNEASIKSQTALDKIMARVQDIKAFAQPLLAKALYERYNVTLDVNATFLRLMKPLTFGPLHVKVSVFPVLTLSLLDAALHNFEAFENDRGAFDDSSGFVTRPDEHGNTETITTALTTQNFIAVCRTLDIGQKYQDYLKSFLLSGEPVAEAFLSLKFIACQKDALKAAAYMALVKNDIEPTDYNIILSVIAGETKVMNGNTPVWFWEPVILHKVLTGCLAFVTVEAHRRDIKEVILYIPHDPEHPVKKYRGMQAVDELTRQLLATGTPTGETTASPTDYARFLSQFLDYKDRPYFFNRLTKEAADAPSDPLAPFRSPITAGFISITGGALGMSLTPNELPPAKPAPRVPVTELDIRLAYRNRDGYWAENADLWAQLFQRSRDKILSDARSHTVPTADADARSRADRIAHLLEGAMAALNLVSMFVPVLGEVMLAVMAGQLMYETLEGSIEWSEGDREAAWAHLSDVAENLALIGVMAVGGRVIKGVKASPFVDSLKPVQLPSGETRLWKPDTKPYEASVSLPENSVHNESGLHQVGGQEVLPLGNQLYVVKENPATGEYRIQHPRRPDAYHPLVEHNGDGAWVHEGEEPLSWEGPTLMRRLGYRSDAFTDAQLEQVRIASGIEQDQLRRVHVEQEPPSALLTDTLTRFRIDRDIETFSRQIASDDPSVYARADVRLQFQVMDSQELIPGRPPVRAMDSQANILWEDPPGSGSSPHRLDMVMSRSSLATGQLLKSLLQTLEAQGVDLAQAPGEPGTSLDLRATALRKDIARGAQRTKATLFESLYRKQDVRVDAYGQRIKAFFPTLPGAVVNQIIEGATTQELAGLGQPGPLPQRIYEQARWCRQELRVARAYEGFYLDVSSNLDGQRLALRSLASLPGWPKGVRFELREYWASGRLIDAVGAPDAPVRKVLVSGENGLYGADAYEGLYSAVLQALSEDQRLALGFSGQEAESLKQTVQRTPLSREALRDALVQHRQLRPAFDPDNKLLGGAGYSLPSAQELASFFKTSRARARKLFPGFQDADIETFLQSLGPDPRRSLTRLEAEYATLKRELKAWVFGHRSPSLGIRETVESHVASNIKRCWRRETGSTLKINQWVELPALSVDFDHVEELTFMSAGLKARTDGFLKSFKNLKRLTINRAEEGLTQLPDSIGLMKGLTHLDVNWQSIVLTEQSANLLGGMSTLEVLKLSGNPLGRLPDFSAMPRLQEVRLQRTGIDQWPVGFRDQAGLRTIDLRNNQLHEAPAALLNPAAEQLEAVARANRVTLLEGNPFTRQNALQLWDYRQRLMQTRPDLLEGGLDGAFEVNTPLHRRYRAVYPDATYGQVEDYFNGLGSEEQINAEVDRLGVALRRLNSQLSEWAYTGEEPQQYVYVRNRANIGLRQDRYLAAERIRSCWQRRTAQLLATDGTPIGFELDLSRLRLPNLPELDVDFSHVGSLKLSNMGLTVTPEAFLRRNSGVRWLDLSGNQLTELPRALNEMNGLTRLFLQGNRIRLTPETAGILAERTTLRALSLYGNPLGMAPDFSRLTDMRSLTLGATGIDTWPVGLAEQPALDGIDLRDNRIATIPDSVIAPSSERLEQSARINNVTYIQGNPLSEATQRQLVEYWSRLERERPDLYVERRQDRGARAFEYRAPAPRGAVVPLAAETEAALGRWTLDMSTEVLATRRAQWRTLSAQQGSAGFFSVLADLQEAGAGHEDLQQRVWAVIDSITQPNLESEQLREAMFEWAGRPACCDRAALSFSNLEIMAMVYKARTLAQDGQQGAALLKLSRGLFRLDKVEKIALFDIQRRTAAINATPGWSSAQKAQHIESLEEVEIKLAYRFGLKDRLGLPGQPQRVRFTSLGRVTPQMLDSAQTQVLALDNSPEELQALVERDFWKSYLANKYKSQFETQQTPYQAKQASLYEALESGELSQASYKGQSADLDAQLQIEEAALVETLTRQELAENPL
jgi:Leucine-rich repeat (LRR) protein